MHTNSGHTHSLTDTISVTHKLTHTQKHIQEHIPHGVGNMSEQSIIWHLNQSLLLEVSRNASGEICLDDKQLVNSFSPLTALKVKKTYIFPKHWLVHVERLHCAVLYICIVVLCFFTQGYVRFGRVFYIQRHFSHDFYFIKYCVVTVKATGRFVVTQQCVPTHNGADLQIPNEVNCTENKLQ